MEGRLNLQGLIGFVGLAAVWEVVASSGFFDAMLFPHLPTVVLAALQEMTDPVFLGALTATLWKTIIAFALSVVLAVPAGLLIGSSARLANLLAPVIDFLRSVPATALFPAFLMFFGYGTSAKLALAIYPSVLLILVGSSYGVRSANQMRIAVFRQLGASRARVFRQVVFFEALPSILGSARIALSLVLVLVVVAELLVPSQPGLGTMIYNAQQNFDTALMYAGIGITGVLGYLLNLAFLGLERKLAPWGARRNSFP